MDKKYKPRKDGTSVYELNEKVYINPFAGKEVLLRILTNSVTHSYVFRYYGEARTLQFRKNEESNYTDF